MVRLHVRDELRAHAPVRALVAAELVGERAEQAVAVGLHGLDAARERGELRRERLLLGRRVAAARAPPLLLQLLAPRALVALRRAGRAGGLALELGLGHPRGARVKRRRARVRRLGTRTLQGVLP